MREKHEQCTTSTRSPRLLRLSHDSDGAVDTVVLIHSAKASDSRFSNIQLCRLSLANYLSLEGKQQTRDATLLLARAGVSAAEDLFVLSEGASLPISLKCLLVTLQNVNTSVCICRIQTHEPPEVELKIKQPGSFQCHSRSLTSMASCQLRHSCSSLAILFAPIFGMQLGSRDEDRDWIPFQLEYGGEASRGRSARLLPVLELFGVRVPTVSIITTTELNPWSQTSLHR